MDDSVKRQRIVKIKEQSYVLDEIPSESSVVVLDEKDKLLGVIDLRTLVNDLNRVGAFIRIAYNGVGAAGYEHTNEQIEIQKLGYDIASICNKSALTVAKFKKASSIILNCLRCTYGYLLENMEEMALDTFSTVSKLAGEMEEAALELYEDFEEQEKKVVKTLEKTQRAKKIKASKIQEEKDKRMQLVEDIKHENELIKQHQEKEREVEIRRRAIEQKEDEAISEIGSLSIKSLINCLTFATIGVRLFDNEAPERRAEKLRQTRLDALELEKEIQQKRQEALAKMSVFTAKLNQCKDDQGIAECAVEALHEAVGALKNLSAVMMRVAMFWKQMQDHCHSLAGSEMKRQVEKALEYSEEKRLKVWTSYPFKCRAIQFYASWVALNSVCTEYKKQIKVTQDDLYKFISENPTYEESKAMLPDLAEKFMADINKDQKALEKKTLKAQEEIQALGEAKEQ